MTVVWLLHHGFTMVVSDGFIGVALDGRAAEDRRNVQLRPDTAANANGSIDVYFEILPFLSV